MVSIRELPTSGGVGITCRDGYRGEGLVFGDGCRVCSGSVELHVRAREAGLLAREWRLLRAVYRHCRREGWWPSAADLAWRFRRSRRTLTREFAVLRERGFVAQPSHRQWATTVLGCEALGQPVLSAKRRWRDREWLHRQRVDAREALEVME